MSIKYAILGLLSWKPATGYDLKKVFEDSASLYWSGNNNQIYKSLLQLQQENLVTNEVHHEDNSPSKKIYTITNKGMTELKEWVKSSPEAPEFKKTFLIKLAWSDLLNDGELDELLKRYEEEVTSELLINTEKKRRGIGTPNRTQREILLWQMISDNLIMTYQTELNWIRELRKKIFNK